MLHIDFETRSLLELRGKNSVGLWNYASSESTQVLMLAWAFDDEEVNIWFPEDPMPERLRAGLLDPSMEISAFNSSFERYILRFKLGMEIPAARFQDPQPSGRMLSLPASLEEQGEILGLPVELQKDKRGEQLIDMFSKPQVKKKRGQEPFYYFLNKETNPNEWAEFAEYCKQDVRAEREIIRRQRLLGVFPLPDLERKIWILDQKINDRGIPANREFATKAHELATRDKKEQLDALNTLTGLDNANSRDQMLGWMQTQGYTENSLRKGAVETTLKYQKDQLTPDGLKALKARKAASSTSYKKFETLLRNMNSDDRLRNQFIYLGSARAGRFSSGATQLHNMARPLEMFENLSLLDRARQLILAEDTESIKNEFKDEKTGEWGSVLLTIKSCLRTTFEAEKGKRLNVSDLNAIETRVGAYVAECGTLLNGFRNVKDFDSYIDYAGRMTGIPYETLIRNKKSDDPRLKAQAKRLRQFGKVGMLGAIYRMGGGGWGWRKNADGTKDKIKTGLWGFAESVGVEITCEEAHQIVTVFREIYHEIKDCWIKIERAITDVLKGVNIVRHIGPNDCIRFDKVPLTDRNPILRIHLPSGRILHYFDCRIETDAKMPWSLKDDNGNLVLGDDGEEIAATGTAIVYAGQNQTTKQWGQWVTSHGGKFFENIVQGIARDCLTHFMLEVDQNTGLEIVGHVHDEIITEGPDDDLAPGVLDMEHIMSQDIPWAPGLPLAADGFESRYYHK